MKPSGRRLRTALALGLALAACPGGGALAFQMRQNTGRFDALVIAPPAQAAGVATLSAASLAPTDPARKRWDEFRNAHGPAWSVYLDRRSGAPLLVEGSGIPWAVEPGATVDTLAASLRGFVASHRELLLADDAELVVDHDASGSLSEDVWQIVFTRAIAGVPVVGERYVFTIGHGRLISFGAPRWSRIGASPFPEIDAKEAQDRVFAYMGLSAKDRVELADKGSLQLLGYPSALVWRIVLRVADEPGTWEALVDAKDATILSLSDINDYAQVKGGVYPGSNDGAPPDGVEQPGFPMPFANVTVGAAAQTSTASGFFSCAPGGSLATTSLAGPYLKVVDACGAVSQAVTCDTDLDLSSGPGTDCAVPAGASAGDTHAARSSFYHLNRIAEHGRKWLPSRAWLSNQLVDNVNLNQTCNAYWDPSSGTVNFFKSGGGCANTGEIAGIFLHEWGHGLDANDGGGFDNPTEAYADVTAFMSTHNSCIGRGFASFNCGGYGDACLGCTGIRDQDWAKHASGTPATPSGFVAASCPLGTGPCGREIHCEGYVAGEALWDLAVRDLATAGLDPASAWQLADKLWFKSRLGSGGNAYNCSLPSSDGCSATSWFSKLRAVDDDDGNLANGTPHAAAIFAAFNRHQIACGGVGDASNQNSTTCPSIGSATLSGTAGANAAQLSWSAVAGAASYNILRNDVSCAAGSTIVANVAGTSFIDTGLANGFTEYYTVQAAGASAACDGRLSNCQSVTPQPLAGLVKLDAGLYNCAGSIGVTVIDANIGAGTTTVTVASTTEPAGETVTLTRIAPGSATYAGVLTTTAAAPAANGLLSVANGDTIIATYVDANDGQGGVNVARQTTAGVDCIFPVISNVASGALTPLSFRVTWNTSEAATSVVHYGPASPPAGAASVPATATSHAVDLSGLAACTTYLFAVESADAAGNIAVDSAGGAYRAFVTGNMRTATPASSDTPIAIPDATPAGAASTIQVPDADLVRGVKVTVNVSHTYDADLVLSLIPPVGAPIILSNTRGGFGDNFVNTVFDDAASVPIASGTAPFAGSFRPESPLAAVNGISAIGAWKLQAVDTAGLDVGTIDGWTLSLTFNASCGPHAVYQSHAPVSDACGTGGAGNGDGVWDAGEVVNFKLNLKNDGTIPLTGLTATVVPTTPGVVMLDGTAGYPSLAGGAAADSSAPHFTALLPASLACGSVAAFDVAIASDQGSWSGSFTEGVGVVTPPAGTALNETFAGGIPGTWTVVDGGTGGGVAATWTTANPGQRPIAPPMSAPVAMVDSDAAGNTGATQDEQLITPLMNFAAATSVTLQFDQYFRWFEDGLAELADVDVRSSATGGAWVNALRQQGAASPNPDHRTIDLSNQAAGANSVQVRFHYYNARSEWYWQVDNVRVDFTLPPACSQHACAAAPGIVKPVADGSFGTAMRGSRADTPGSTIGLTWDVTTCASTDHHLLYGNLSTVAASTVSGAVCHLGASGAATWSAVPAGSLWFVVVGDNDAVTEGSWGMMTSGERGGTLASGRCGLTARDNAGTCP